MVDKVEVQAPVEIKDNSLERVTFDLMEKIAKYEGNNKIQPNPREYFLKLYNQCHKVVSYSGTNIDTLLNN